MDHRLLAMENDQALDFTSTPKRSISRDQSSLESSPVLDLSCKKHQSSAPSCTLSPLSIEAISNPPSIENPHGEQNGIGHEDDHDSSDHQSQHEVQHRRHDSRYVHDSDESKSPFEARNFMVTPPSEIDSPRKPKYETIYDRMSAGVASVVSSNDEKTLTSGYAMVPSGIALPSCPAAILSSIVMPPNGVEATSALQFPVSTTTTSTNSIAANLVHEISANGQHEVNSKKAPRPFKAYPKDPLSMSIGSAELVYDQTSTEAYSEFRKRMLESVRRTNEGTNIKMRRVTKSPGLPTSTIMDEKDAAYWERRRKNNEAAKRSRDARRAKEDEIAIRAAFLEQENMKLKYELVALRNETAKLRCMIYTN